MASSCIVQIATVNNVKKHPDADALDTCEVLGWQMCVPIGRYKDGDEVVYFPSDTILTDEWIDKFDVRNYLTGKESNRVHRVKLRGEPSFGLAVDIPDGLIANVGDNVAYFFGQQNMSSLRKNLCKTLSL